MRREHVDLGSGAVIAYGHWGRPLLVSPWIASDCGGPVEIMTAGCTLGAFHAVNIALRAQLRHHLPRFC